MRNKTRISVLVCAVLAMASVTTVGCRGTNPCQQLVEKVCAEGTADECAHLKKITAEADEDTVAVCADLLKVQPDRTKGVTSCDKLADMVCAERPLKDCLNMRNEAVDASFKKSQVCEKFAKLIVDTRKHNADKKAGLPVANSNPPKAKLKIKKPPAQLLQEAAGVKPEKKEQASEVEAPGAQD